MSLLMMSVKSSYRVNKVLAQYFSRVDPSPTRSVQIQASRTGAWRTPAIFHYFDWAVLR